MGLNRPEGLFSSQFWTSYLSLQRHKLPKLPDVDDTVSNRVVRFLGVNPGDLQLQGTNTYLVGTGRFRILIDTGEGLPQWAVNLTQYLEDHEISISHILLTHWHPDHTGGVDDMLTYDKSIKVYKRNPSPVQRDITEGQVFRTEGATLKAVFAPGHAVDHTCFFLDEENALFTGDNVLGHGFSVIEDLVAYTESLRRMATLECGLGYPGHGAVVENLPDKITSYISHWESREHQVYDALLKRASDAGRSSSYDSPLGGTKDNESRSIRSALSRDGLSVSEISLRLYGPVSKDAATFESVLEPMISQVLRVLVEKGKVDFKVVGLERMKYWFARAQATEKGD